MRFGFSSKLSQLSHRSRIVFILKIALPSAAALIFGIMIIIPGIENIKKTTLHIPKVDPRSGISFILNQGNFLSRGDDGTIFDVKTKRLIEAKSNGELLFEGVRAIANFENGGWINVFSDKGVFHRERRRIDMDGNLHLVDSDGNRATTISANVDLVSSVVTGNDPIMIETGFGYIVGEGFNFEYDTRYEVKGRINAKINIK